MKASQLRHRKIGILHYTAPPVVGGVEAVMQAHAQTFIEEGYPVTIIAGRGDAAVIPEGAELIIIQEVDSQHGELTEVSALLEAGELPESFDQHVERIYSCLAEVMPEFSNLIIHNLFTKHFNLPLTAAVHRLIDSGVISNPIAWCHDFSWSSPNSRSKVHPGYPWELLRTYRSDTAYVTVSRQRQRTLAELFGCDKDRIKVIYNGVDPALLLNLTPEGQALIDRLDLFSADPVILMPVRVTRAKNIELALRVAAELKKLAAGLRMVLTGPPDPHDEQSIGYYKSLLNLRRQLGVEDAMRFVYESGPEGAGMPYTIEYPIVSDLLRVCDLVFMPSHREGFGMPVLEAGLVGAPVVCTPIPAAEEITARETHTMQPHDSPEKVAGLIYDLLENNPLCSIRRRVRREYTWQAIFRKDIQPLLNQEINA